MKKKTTITYISQVYDLIKTSNQCRKPIYINQGSVTVDGSSILGILSLDLFQPIYIVSEDEKDLNKFNAFLEFEDEKKET